MESGKKNASSAQTWRDMKAISKKRTKMQQSNCDDADSSHNESESPPKKKCVSFDEEIITIEKDKLELDREYKIRKIEALSRIATALEEIASKK